MVVTQVLEKQNNEEHYVYGEQHKPTDKRHEKIRNSFFHQSDKQAKKCIKNAIQFQTKTNELIQSIENEFIYSMEQVDNKLKMLQKMSKAHKLNAVHRDRLIRIYDEIQTHRRQKTLV